MKPLGIRTSVENTHISTDRRVLTFAVSAGVGTPTAFFFEAAISTESNAATRLGGGAESRRWRTSSNAVLTFNTKNPIAVSGLSLLLLTVVFAPV